MSEILRKYLRELDLSEREVQTYLSCLELGVSPILPIARKVGHPRTSVSYILEKLQNRGLISIAQKGSRKIYSPTAPGKIITLLKNRRSRIDEQIGALESSLPELNQLYAAIPFATKVRFFQGKDEIRKMYDEILTYPINEIIYVAEVDKMEAVLGKQWLKNWITRRISKKIQTRAVRVENKEVNEDLYGDSSALFRKVRFAPQGFTCPTHILIYGDNVTLMTTAKESLGVVITSRDFAQSMKSWFSLIWKISKSTRSEKI